MQRLFTPHPSKTHQGVSKEDEEEQWVVQSCQNGEGQQGAHRRINKLGLYNNGQYGMEEENVFDILQVGGSNYGEYMWSLKTTLGAHGVICDFL